jgi:hypothetical protein
MNQTVLEHFITLVQPSYGRSLFSKITCPTLVLSGDDDSVTRRRARGERRRTRSSWCGTRYAGGHGMFGDA